MEFSPLSQLCQGNTTWRIHVFVSHLWQHRCGTDHGPIKHTDLVLLDSQGNHMYAEIPEKNVDNFMDRIEEGKIYDIHKLLVFPRKFVFRAVEGHSMIKFTRCTTVVERLGMEAEFPCCTYALTPLAHLPKPADMPARFTDVLGMITGISEAVQYVSASRPEPSTKRVIRLADLTDHHITVILWGNATLNFEADELMDLSAAEPVIAIFVGTLVKTYDGHRGVSGSAACRWYENEDLPDIREFRARLRGKSTPIEHIDLPGQTVAEVDAQVNLQTKTIRELADLDMFDNRDARFLCTAVLSKLNPFQQWWFSSCTTCHKSSIPDGAGYRCSDPKCVGTDAIPRYRICYIARDDGAEVNDPGEAEFVFFDRVGRELIESPLISLLRHGRSPVAPLQEIVQSARADLAVPRELAAVVSHKFRFVVSISNKCFATEDDDLSFQVLRIDAPLGQQSRSSVVLRPSAGASGSSGSSSLPNVPLMPPVSLTPSVKVLGATSITIGSTAAPLDGRTPLALPTSPLSITKPSVIEDVASGITPKAQRKLFKDGLPNLADDPPHNITTNELVHPTGKDLATEALPSTDETAPGKGNLQEIDAATNTSAISLVDQLSNAKRPDPPLPITKPAGSGKRGRNK